MATNWCFLRHNPGMPPAVLNGVGTDQSPGLLGDPHGLEKVNLVDVWLICIIKVKSSLAKEPLVMSFVTLEDSRIKRLDVGSNVGSKVDKFDIFWHILNEVAQEIIDEEDHIPALLPHLDVEVLYEPESKSEDVEPVCGATLTIQREVLSSRPSCCLHNGTQMPMTPCF
jgi:hypothetical protein